MTSIALFVSSLAILSLGINQALIVRRLQRHEAAVAAATAEMSIAQGVRASASASDTPVTIAGVSAAMASASVAEPARSCACSNEVCRVCRGSSSGPNSASKPINTAAIAAAAASESAAAARAF